MRTAEVRIRPEPYYRRQAIEQGLTRLGFVLGTARDPDDLLVLWGRKKGRDDDEASQHEARGGRVLVIENGYLQKVDKTYYAISLSQHHSGGPVGTGDRFAALGFEVKPWRQNPEGHVLVCGQRGIGSRLMSSPPHWAEKWVKTFGFRLRPHPGNVAPKVPIEHDLAGVRACLVWSSAAGVRALVEGIPVVACAPHWICSKGASTGLTNLGYGDVSRAAALQKAAWSQWTPAEIATGEPFALLLSHTPRFGG